MNSVTVNAEHEYDVIVDCQWQEELRKAAHDSSRILIIHSSALAQPSIDSMNAEVIYCPIDDGESGKSLDSLNRIWNVLGASGFTRSDLIVAIGGGAVTDVAGFAAATWLRGMNWIAIPTTIAGMVDASIGGKTAINSSYGKNLIGAFHSPRAVLIDISHASTLSDRDFSAGLAEVIKCGFIADPTILSDVSSVTLTDIRNDARQLTSLITKAISVKAKVVSEDFHESYLREILNYGHTFGHAVEKHSGFTLRHGECVAMGMVFVAELLFAQSDIDQQLLDLHRTLLAQFELPTKLPSTYTRDQCDALYAFMKLDKKVRGSNIRFVGIRTPGEATRLENLTYEELFAAYEKVLA